MIEKGKRYKTVGGWEAEVVWVKHNGFYAVHIDPAPQAPPSQHLWLQMDDTVPIWHHMNGEAYPVFSVGEPPRFGKQHPADIILEGD